MMRFLTPLLILAGMGVLGIYFFDRDRILDLIPNLVSSTTPSSQPGQPSPALSRGNIVIASWNLQANTSFSARDTSLSETIAPIVSRFDVVALQGLSLQDDPLLDAVMDELAAQGRNYRLVKSGPIGMTATPEQLAFIYDAQTLEIDPTTYVVGDPDGLFRFPPFVGAFRVLGPSPQTAFTFTLVNTRLDQREAPLEINFLDDVFRAVRADGREEDDVILIGTLQTSPDRFGDLRRIPHTAWAIEGRPTTLLGSGPLDNLVFDGRATAEYRQTSGVFELPQETPSNGGIPVSSGPQLTHRPIWASFGIEEAIGTGP
jgi:hypothetical protein